MKLVITENDSLYYVFDTSNNYLHGPFNNIRKENGIKSDVTFIHSFDNSETGEHVRVFTNQRINFLQCPLMINAYRFQHKVVA